MNIVKDYRLMSMPHAQCYVEIFKQWDNPEETDTNSAPHHVFITLVSYDTRVCSIVIEPHGKPRMAVLASGTYSTTTARHINRFTQEFFGVNLYNTIRDVTRAIPDNVYTIRGQRMALCRATGDTGRIVHAMQKVFEYTQNGKRHTGKYN